VLGTISRAGNAPVRGKEEAEPVVVRAGADPVCDGIGPNGRKRSAEVSCHGLAAVLCATMLTRR